MNFKECLEKRYSCRDFIDYELNKNELEEIIKLARLSPSAVNMQPAKICFLSKDNLENLKNSLLNAEKEYKMPSQDLILYPKIWFEPYKTRRFETGLKLYETIGISRDDKEKRLEQWHKNYKFFNAKNLAILYIDNNLSEGAVLDAGIFLANFLNAATYLGFQTCVLGSLLKYCNEIKEISKIDGRILSAVAIGKESDDKINSFRTEKLSVEEIASFI